MINGWDKKKTRNILMLLNFFQIWEKVRKNKNCAVENRKKIFHLKNSPQFSLSPFLPILTPTSFSLWHTSSVSLQLKSLFPNLSFHSCDWITRLGRFCVWFWQFSSVFFLRLVVFIQSSVDMNRETYTIKTISNRFSNFSSSFFLPLKHDENDARGHQKATISEIKIN